jgi:hypothetical protein
MTINALRGFEQFNLKPEEMWGWLFSDKQTDKTIELTATMSDKKRRSLKIKLVDPKESRVVVPTESNEGTAGTGSPAEAQKELLYEFEDIRGKKLSTRLYIAVDGIKLSEPQSMIEPSGIFFSASSRPLREDAERFSNLERVGRHEEILLTVKFIEPRIKRLAVLVTGGVPLINADIGLRELVPVPHLGAGFVRLLSILLAIRSFPGGLVLIDEIENGFHHSVMRKVWAAIGEAARKEDAQIIATTHSWECIQAGHEAFLQVEKYDFKLQRLEVVDNRIEAISYDKKTLDAALRAELEVR